MPWGTGRAAAGDKSTWMVSGAVSTFRAAWARAVATFSSRLDTSSCPWTSSSSASLLESFRLSIASHNPATTRTRQIEAQRAVHTGVQSRRRVETGRAPPSHSAPQRSPGRDPARAGSPRPPLPQKGFGGARGQSNGCEPSPAANWRGFRARNRNSRQCARSDGRCPARLPQRPRCHLRYAWTPNTPVLRNGRTGCRARPRRHSACGGSGTRQSRGDLAVGVRLAVPSWFGGAIEMKRVRQAAPLQPGRQSQWPIVKSQVLRGTSSYATGIASFPVSRLQFRFRHSPA